MIEHHRPVSKRMQIARRWQWVAAAASILFVLTCFVGWPFGYFWPSVIGFVAFLPSIWVFSVKCSNCGWPAFTDYEADEQLRRDERFYNRSWGKEYRGINLPLSSACTKCGTRFV